MMGEINFIENEIYRNKKKSGSYVILVVMIDIIVI